MDPLRPIEEVCGRLFCATTRVGAGEVQKSGASRCSALIGECRGDPPPLYGNKTPHERRASRVDGGVCRFAAGLVWDARGGAFTRSCNPICAFGLILESFFCKDSARRGALQTPMGA